MPRLDGRQIPGLPSTEPSARSYPRPDARRRGALQQEALGIVGVNLSMERFSPSRPEAARIAARWLTTGRIEIDMIEFTGIEFRHVDNRVMSLQLVQLGLTGAAMFGLNREVLQPSDVFAKAPCWSSAAVLRPVPRSTWT